MNDANAKFFNIHSAGIRRSSPALLLALLVFALDSAAACADVAAPWEIFSGPRKIRLAVRFENLADYPDHDFYLKYGLGGNPSAWPHVTPVPTNTIFWFESGGRLTEVYLIAVPRGEQPPELPKAPEMDWYKTCAPGTVQVGLGRISDAYSGYELSFRVAIAGGQMSVVQTSSYVSPVNWVRNHIELIVVGLAMSLGIAFAGLWIVRRLRRAAKPAI